MGAPWDGVLHPPLGKQNKKPRSSRITMVIDKGMGIRELADLLEVAGCCLDCLKLGFGTSVLYNREVLQKKIELCRQFDVDIYPGGTLTEIAIFQGKFDAFLERAKELGFETIEISDGTISLDKNKRLTTIRQAIAAGFKVITELGKKDPLHSPSLGEMLQLGQDDLAAGAWKIIIEARESGKGIGIYDNNGAVISDLLEGLASGLSEVLNSVIWEAPLKNQQVSLISRFGPNVNLGNIQPTELLALETLRCGLRGDTFRLALPRETIDPALIGA